MHSLPILVELVIGLAATGLVSRRLFVTLAGWQGGFAKSFAVHLWSFALAGLLFVICCSTPEAVSGFAAHKIFLPQAAWFIRDCLRMTGQDAPEPAAESGANHVPARRRPGRG